MSGVFVLFDGVQQRASLMSGSSSVVLVVQQRAIPVCVCLRVCIRP